MGILRKSKPGEPLEYARHPLVYMVEAADDICYEIMDIEDSHKLKILSFEETADLLLGFFDEETQQKIRQRILDEGLTDENEQVVYMRACVIGKLENECVNVFLNHEEEILAGTSRDVSSNISPNISAKPIRNVRRFPARKSMPANRFSTSNFRVTRSWLP